MRQPDSVALSALACLLPDDPYRRRQLTDGTIFDQLRWAYGLSVNMIQINAHALQSAMVTTGRLAKYPFRGSAPKAGVHTSHAGLSLSGRRYIVTGPTAPPRMRCSARRDEVSRGLLNIWRRKARLASSEGPQFVQLRLDDAVEARPDAIEQPCVEADPAERIEVTIAGATVRVPVGVDAATLKRVLAAVRWTR